jgi:hypothetical protein
MSDNITSASRASAIGGYEPSLEEKRERRDTSDAAWALVLTDAVLHQLPRFTLDLAPPSPDASEDAEGATSALDPELSARSELAAHGDPGGALGSSNAVPGGGDGPDALDQLSAHFDDARLGKVAFTVTRQAHGLDIVIGVADSDVKALIEADRLVLIQALKAAGLHVSRVEVMGSETAGTLLAPNPRGVRSSMSPRGQSAKVRAYRTSLEEEAASTADNVDLTA